MISKPIGENALYFEILKFFPLGLLVIDEQYNIKEWNNWLVKHTKIESKSVIDKDLFTIFPELKENERFLLSLQQVFQFSSPHFLSHSLHRSIFHIEVDKKTYKEFDYMQQDITLCPIEIDKIKYALITISDKTAFAHLKLTLMKMGHKFERLSLIDPMTKLYNRRCLYEHLSSAFEHAKKNPKKILCCTLFDLDYFKKINDTLGHQAGDEVIISFANTLLSSIPARDYAFRLGGEEFALIYFVHREKDIEIIPKKIHKDFSSLTHHGNVKKIVTCSVGIAFWHSKLEIISSDRLIQQADSALYIAKENGRNQVILYA